MSTSAGILIKMLLPGQDPTGSKAARIYHFFLWATTPGTTPGIISPLTSTTKQQSSKNKILTNKQTTKQKQQERALLSNRSVLLLRSRSTLNFYF